MKKWKSLLAAAATAAFLGSVLAGCGGDGTGSGIGIGGGGKDTALSAPKEAIGQVKFNGKDVPVYEYKGEGLPDMVHTTTNLTVTKDAIYAGKFDASGDKKQHLVKLSVKDGAITSVEDLGILTAQPITTDGTNVYYQLGENICAYDGSAVTKSKRGEADIMRAVHGTETIYTSGDPLKSQDIEMGTISKEGIKDLKSVLPKAEFAALNENKKENEENQAFLLWADADGFYISTIATNGGPPNKRTYPLHMYGPDGKKIRTFECNEGIPDSAEKRKISERQSIATKDYVVFYDSGFLRVFNKKDGKYVGDVELKINGKNIEPAGAAVDDENHIYFIDHKTDANIYRIDL